MLYFLLLVFTKTIIPGKGLEDLIRNLDGKYVAIFAAASPNIELENLAKKLAIALVDVNLNILYGGGLGGPMSAGPETMMERTGRMSSVVGVLPQIWADEESIGLTQIVPTIADRKFAFLKVASAYIALPGGLGTLDELTDIITSKQIGDHKKSIIVLNYNHFYDGFKEQLEVGLGYGVIKPEHSDIVKFVESVEDIIEIIKKEMENYEDFCPPIRTPPRLQY